MAEEAAPLYYSTIRRKNYPPHARHYHQPRRHPGHHHTQRPLGSTRNHWGNLHRPNPRQGEQYPVPVHRWERMGPQTPVSRATLPLAALTLNRLVAYNTATRIRNIFWVRSDTTTVNLLTAWEQAPGITVGDLIRELRRLMAHHLIIKHATDPLSLTITEGDMGRVTFLNGKTGHNTHRFHDTTGFTLNQVTYHIPEYLRPFVLTLPKGQISVAAMLLALEKLDGVDRDTILTGIYPEFIARRARENWLASWLRNHNHYVKNVTVRQARRFLKTLTWALTETTTQQTPQKTGKEPR